MARRNNSKNSTTPTQTEEQDVTTTQPEAPAETPTENTPTEAPKPVDLTTFQAAANEAVSNADTSTGEIATAGVEAVVKEYRAIEGLKGKNAAKTWLNDQMKARMGADDIVGARSFLQLHEQMSAGASSSTPKAPADPTEAFVQSEATLRLAGLLHEPGEGVAEDHEDKVQSLVQTSTEAAISYRDWLQSDAEDKGDEPEVSAVVKNAVKLAVGKAAKVGGRATGGGSTFTGDRRDIGKHIAEAFANEPSGAFKTVAEIRKFKSAEYGDNPPSAGAISARLFPKSGKCTVEGIEPGKNDKGNNGATKA